MSERNDIDLQKYLAGDSAVSRRYRALEQDEPAPELDARILAAARTEARLPTRPAWMVPLAVAATVVLGVGLSLQLQPPRQELLESVQEYEAEPAQRAAPEREAPPRRAREADADGSTSIAAAPSADEARQAAEKMSQTQRDDPRAAIESNLGEVAPRAAAAPPAEPTPAEPTPSGFAPPPPEADAALQSYRRDQGVPADDRAREESSAPELAAFARQSADAPALLAPEVRLERIEALWKVGAKTRAIELLEEFREDFPEYVIPESFPVQLPIEKDPDAPASPPAE